MKSPMKLQEKLVQLLRGTPALNVLPSHQLPWNDLELKEVAWVVQDFVNQSSDVTNSDPLKDWLEEYRFFLADRKDG